LGRDAGRDRAEAAGTWRGGEGAGLQLRYRRALSLGAGLPTGMSLEPVVYRDGGIALTGLLARPAGRARAAVVVFPTIANATPAVERRAAMLADAGFLALIADFYGERVESFEASRPLAEKLREDVGIYRGRLLAAVEALRGHP